jgi:predicted AAA+ superfamily ATPase
VPLNLSAVAKETGISSPTIKKLLFAFEAVFLLKSVPLAGDYGDVVYYFEDMCEHQHLYQGTQNELSQVTHFLFNHIRGEFAYSQNQHDIRMFQYRTRAGVIVPIVVESNGQVLGVIPTQEEKPNRQEIAGGDSLLKRYAHSKIVFVNGSAKSQVIDERRFIVRLSATC